MFTTSTIGSFMGNIQPVTDTRTVCDMNELLEVLFVVVSGQLKCHTI